MSLHWETVAIVLIGCASSGFRGPSFEREEHWLNLIARVIAKDGITRICYTSVFLKATALLLSYSPGKEAYVFPRLPIFAE